MENNKNLKFEVLVKEMVKNIFRLNQEYVKMRKEFRLIKFKICLYALLVVMLLSFIITQAENNGIFILSGTWQIAFLFNCLKTCAFLTCIALIIMLYMNIRPLKNESIESLKMSELEEYGSNIYSITTRLKKLGEQIRLMYQVTNTVYTMFWVALCRRHTDRAYCDIRKGFLDDEFVPKAFKELFTVSEEELITYDYNNDDKLNVLVHYMRSDKNLLDFLEIVMCQGLITYDDLPAFCKQGEDNGQHSTTK